MMPAAEIFKQRLAEEWQSLTPSEADPLYEAIRPDGSLLRLNLRPYKAAGGSLDELASACLETGQRAWGTQADLLQTWGEFLALCQAGCWSNLAPADCSSFTTWLQEQGFPPIHHSKRYRSLYQPAYRLVLGRDTPYSDQAIPPY